MAPNDEAQRAWRARAITHDENSKKKLQNITELSPLEQVKVPPSETAQRLSAFNPWKSDSSPKKKNGKVLAVFDANTGEGWVWKGAGETRLDGGTGKVRRFRSEKRATRWLEKEVSSLPKSTLTLPSAGYKKQHLDTTKEKAAHEDYIPLSSSPEPPFNLRTLILSSSVPLPTPKEATSAPDPTLSPEQLSTLRLVVYGGISLLITGGAGTGKSLLLRSIVKALKKRHGPNEVAVTATTGIAGINISGSTIHSWAGIGLGNSLFSDLLVKITGNPKLRKRWRQVDVLVIDEVSMLDAMLFDKLERIAREVRCDERPFGGIQLVLCGDFFQLPPVIPSNSLFYPKSKQEQAYDLLRDSYTSNFAFDAPSWNSCVPRTIILQRVFRQTEKDLVHHLECVRRGIVTPEISDFFQSLSRGIDCSDGILAADLFPKKSEMEKRNRERLDGLLGIPHTFHARDSIKWTSFYMNELEEMRVKKRMLAELAKSTIAPRVLELRVGAQVMLIKNLTHEGLVNGSLGVVAGFRRVDGSMLKEPQGRTFVDEQVEHERYFDADLQSQEEPVMPLQHTASLPLFAAQIGHTWNGTLDQEREYPVVRFSKGLAKDSCIEMVVTPMSFDLESPVTGEIGASRFQVPLILAWAMSIHKAQGQTMTRVKVDLSSIFESGQAYVALSRATCVEGLQVVGFMPEKIRADERVIEWFRQQEGRAKGRPKFMKEEEEDIIESKREEFYHRIV